MCNLYQFNHIKFLKHYENLFVILGISEMERGTATVAQCKNISYPSINSSHQISIFQIHQIFNISNFLNLTYPLRKNISFPWSQNAQKSAKNLHKTAKEWLME